MEKSKKSHSGIWRLNKAGRNLEIQNPKRPDPPTPINLGKTNVANIDDGKNQGVK